MRIVKNKLSHIHYEYMVSIPASGGLLSILCHRDVKDYWAVPDSVIPGKWLCSYMGVAYKVGYNQVTK